MATLVFNAGSSSIKISVFESKSLKELYKGNIDLQSFPIILNLGDKKLTSKAQNEKKALIEILKKLKDTLKEEPIECIGHRVVHGGLKFKNHTKVTAKILSELKARSNLAPLHNPLEIFLIEESQKIWKKVTQIATFDTVFFNTIDQTSYQLPLSKKLSYPELRRYGFHGINHQHCSEWIGAKDRVIVCHLGGGSSCSAILKGKAINTSMGFSPLDGIIMETRPGSIDVGAILYLLKEKKISVKELEKELNCESGVLGISGYTSNIKKLLEDEKKKKSAKLALKMYIDSICKNINAMIYSLKGCDHLIFTGGVGENSATIRKRVVDGLSYLGLSVDSKANKSGCNKEITSQKSNVRIWVIHANENKVIAKTALNLGKKKTLTN